MTKPTPAWTPGQPEPSRERLYHQAPEIRRVEDAVFHPRRIVQATLVARDFDGMLAFYTDVIGLGCGESSPDGAVLSGDCGQRDLVLLRHAAGLEPGLHHLRFEVDTMADLLRSERRAKSLGLALERSAPSAEGIVIRDPDGIRLQFRASDGGGTSDPGAAPYLM